MSIVEELPAEIVSNEEEPMEQQAEDGANGQPIAPKVEDGANEQSINPQSGDEAKEQPVQSGDGANEKPVQSGDVRDKKQDETPAEVEKVVSKLVDETSTPDGKLKMSDLDNVVYDSVEHQLAVENLVRAEIHEQNYRAVVGSEIADAVHGRRSASGEPPLKVSRIRSSPDPEDPQHKDEAKEKADKDDEPNSDEEVESESDDEPFVDGMNRTDNSSPPPKLPKVGKPKSAPEFSDVSNDSDEADAEVVTIGDSPRSAEDEPEPTTDEAPEPAPLLEEEKKVPEESTAVLAPIQE